MIKRIDEQYLRDAAKLLQSALSDSPICIVLVKRMRKHIAKGNEVDPATDKDTFVFVALANAQDALRVNSALREAQKALIEVTKQAMLDGEKQAEELK